MWIIGTLIFVVLYLWSYEKISAVKDAITDWWCPGAEYGWHEEWGLLAYGRSYADKGKPYLKVYWSNLIFRDPISWFILDKLFDLILRFPNFPRGAEIMAWIIRHTPANPNERK